MNDNYYKSFIKNAISDLRINGICYVYFKEQIEEIKKKVKRELVVVKNEYGYTISYKK